MGKEGKLFVLSGPSGVGKGTVLDRLLEEFDDVEYSVSATTRPARQGEKNGVDYFFLSEAEFFQQVKAGKFIEWAKVHNNYYGTPKDYVLKTIKEGKDVILEIDIRGARQVRENYPGAVFIFLAPPSFDELKSRLDHRNSEDEKTKELRLKNARQEMQEMEKYDYVVVNDVLKDAVNKIKAIIIAEKCKLKKGE